MLTYSNLNRLQNGKTQLNGRFVVINKTRTSPKPLDWVRNLYIRKPVFQNYQNYRISKGPPFEIDFFKCQIQIGRLVLT